MLRGRETNRNSWVSKLQDYFSFTSNDRENHVIFAKDIPQRCAGIEEYNIVQFDPAYKEDRRDKSEIHRDGAWRE